MENFTANSMLLIYLEYNIKYFTIDLMKTSLGTKIKKSILIIARDNVLLIYIHN